MTISIYWEIIQNPERAPEKYQLLCRNCNWKKMIENNERQPKERMYAFKGETDELRERVQLLEQKLPRLRERKVTLEKTIKDTHQEISTISYLEEEQIEQILMPAIESLRNEKSQKLDVNKMRVFLRENGVRLSAWKTYQMKGMIEAAHPELFEQP